MFSERYSSVVIYALSLTNIDYKNDKEYMLSNMLTSFKYSLHLDKYERKKEGQKK